MKKSLLILALVAMGTTHAVESQKVAEIRKLLQTEQQKKQFDDLLAQIATENVTELEEIKKEKEEMQAKAEKANQKVAILTTGKSLVESKGLIAEQKYEDKLKAQEKELQEEKAAQLKAQEKELQEEKAALIEKHQNEMLELQEEKDDLIEKHNAAIQDKNNEHALKLEQAMHQKDREMENLRNTHNAKVRELNVRMWLWVNYYRGEIQQKENEHAAKLSELEEQRKKEESENNRAFEVGRLMVEKSGKEKFLAEQAQEAAEREKEAAELEKEEAKLGEEAAKLGQDAAKQKLEEQREKTKKFAGKFIAATLTQKVQERKKMEREREDKMGEMAERRKKKTVTKTLAALKQNAEQAPERNMIRNLLKPENVKWFLDEYNINGSIHQIKDIEKAENAGAVFDALFLGNPSDNRFAGIMAAQQRKKQLDDMRNKGEYEKYVTAFQAEMEEEQQAEMEEEQELEKQKKQQKEVEDLRRQWTLD